VNGSNAENKTITENILQNLKPIIEKMTVDAPEWGTVELNIIFNAGIIKRIEISSNKSIQWNNGK
jgi:hypothetical protein